MSGFADVGHGVFVLLLLVSPFLYDLAQVLGLAVR